MSLNNNDVIFLTRKQYFSEITNKISITKKNDFIALATMNLETNNVCSDLIKAINKSAKNKANISIFYDSYNYIINKYSLPGPLFWHTKLPKKIRLNPWKNLKETVYNLQQNGANTTLTNIPKKRFSIPFSGRSHIKFCVINNNVYLGGCNLSSSDDIDIMLKFSDKKLTNSIKKFIQDVKLKNNVYEALNNKDIQLKINPKTELFIDSGVKNQSLIYEQAMSLIDSAEEYIFMTCQFFPNTTTIKKLKQAYERGVKIELLYNHPSKHPFPKNLLHYFVKFYYQLFLPKDLSSNELPKNNLYIHSKILLNEKTSMVGSHNYVNAGVAFGTAEICLKFNSNLYNDKLISCIKEQINDKPRDP